ncbi:MAG: LemA family protein, partial [Oceanococcaceae bacterium]
MDADSTVNLGRWIFWGVALAGALYAVLIYNNLVRLKHQVSKSWSNIDVLLKQRHDELPKLVETCKQYMQFEQDTLEKVMLARAAAHTARTTHRVPPACHASPFTPLSPPRTCPRARVGHGRGSSAF